MSLKTKLGLKLKLKLGLKLKLKLKFIRSELKFEQIIIFKDP